MGNAFLKINESCSTAVVLALHFVADMLVLHYILFSWRHVGVLLVLCLLCVGMVLLLHFHFCGILLVCLCFDELALPRIR